MNTKKVKSVIEKLKKAFEEIEKSEGVVIKLESFRGTEILVKSQISISDPNMGDKLEKQNTSLSRQYGFSQNIIGLEFTSKKVEYIISEFKPRNPKFPIIVTRKSDGSGWKFGVDTIKKFLGGNNILNRNKNLENLLEND